MICCVRDRAVRVIKSPSAALQVTQHNTLARFGAMRYGHIMEEEVQHIFRDAVKEHGRPVIAARFAKAAHPVELAKLRGQAPDWRNSVSDYRQYQCWVVDAAAPMDGPLRWRRKLH
jgi:plasmid stability protein